MLTVVERNDLWNRSKNPDDFARAIERAVLKKLGEQEPAGLLVVESASRAEFSYYGYMDKGHYCLYPRPLPAQSTCFTSHDMASASAQGFRDGQAQAVPEGYVLVPFEPTPAMLKEIHLIDEFSERALIARYKAMLSAAPKP